MQGDDACGIESFYSEVCRDYEGRRAKMISFAGGDWYVKDHILHILEQAPVKKGCFVEVFGGSGLITQEISREMYKVIVYNDIDDWLTTLYREIKEHPDELMEILSILPYSRRIHDIFRDYLFDDNILNPLIKAVMVFYYLNSTFWGKIGDRTAGFGFGISRNLATAFRSKITKIREVAVKLRDVTIECMDFRKLIDYYDSKNTVFYCDPPYITTDRDRRRLYRFEFKLKDMHDLVRKLNNIKGFYVLKIHEDQMQYLRELNYKYKQTWERYRCMKNVKGKKRDTWHLTILTNYPVDEG